MIILEERVVSFLRYMSMRKLTTMLGTTWIGMIMSILLNNHIQCQAGFVAYSSISSSRSSNTNRNNKISKNLKSVPYCISKVDQNGDANEKSRQIQEISEMCIDVFFNEEDGFT